MAYVAKKITTVWYQSLYGKRIRVAPHTSGAEKHRHESPDYYGFWTDDRGKKHSLRFPGCRVKVEAEQRLRAHLKNDQGEEMLAVSKEKTSPQDSPAVAVLLPDYREHLLHAGRSERYVSETIRHLNLAAEHFPTLASLSVGSVSHYAQQAASCARSRNIILGYLKRFASWCVDRGYLTQSPLEAVERLHGPRRRLRRALDRDSLQKLLDAARERPLVGFLRGTARLHGEHVELSATQKQKLERAGIQRALVYKLAVLTLARWGAIRALKVSSLKLEEPELSITFPTSKRREPVVKKLHPILAEELRQWIQMTGKSSDDPLFDLNSQITRELRKDLAHAGIPYKDAAGRTFDIHALKRTGITLLAQARVHPREVQEYAEHRDIRMTLEVYTEAAGLGSKDLLDAFGELR